MRVLITGAAGFVGAHVARRLAGERLEVVRLGRSGAAGELDIAIDLADRCAVERTLNAVRPDAVLHLAGRTERIDRTAALLRDNVQATLALVAALRSLPKVPRLILAGSAAVYGPTGPVPAGETRATAPDTVYAATKLMQEQIVGRAAAAGVEVNIVRCFNIIGPGQSRGVVPDLLRQIVPNLETPGEEIAVLMGDTGAVRDFLDVRDAAAAFQAIILRGRPGRIYNLCGGRPTAVHEIVRIVEGLVGRKLDLTGTARPENPSNIVLGDCSRLVAELGWKPAFALDATIRDCIKLERDRLNTTG
ncbi:MAG TPA: NAD(P)-dependent oxidoreductase [Alphaproteobacteria bacterium]|nr:NAD(P)-dependent oxidoreductase [Alphaproteobacteria bacterium]